MVALHQCMHTASGPPYDVLHHSQRPRGGPRTLGVPSMLRAQAQQAAIASPHRRQTTIDTYNTRTLWPASPVRKCCTSPVPVRPRKLKSIEDDARLAAGVRPEFPVHVRRRRSGRHGRVDPCTYTYVVLVRTFAHDLHVHVQHMYKGYQRPCFE